MAQIFLSAENTTHETRFIDLPLHLKYRQAWYEEQVRTLHDQHLFFCRAAVQEVL
jgi:hypothetical protein